MALDPKFYGGLDNSFIYKNFQIDIFFQFVKKHGYNYLYSLPSVPGASNTNMPAKLLERWQEQGNVSQTQKFTTGGAGATAWSNYRMSEGAFTDASFLRLKNVRLNYKLPKKMISKFALQNLNLYMQAQNLLTITSYKGNDPEVISLGVLPPLRSFSIGINLTY
jgi:hypothetical protein